MYGLAHICDRPFRDDGERNDICVQIYKMRTMRIYYLFRNHVCKPLAAAIFSIFSLY